MTDQNETLSSNCDQLLQKIKKVTEEDGIPRTLLGICPNSAAVLRAAVRSAKRCDAPLYFVATLNQVDRDEGYTGWTQAELCELIEKEGRKLNFDGPTVVGLDHGGPWMKDRHSTEGLPFAETMEEVKKSFAAAIRAGYGLIHVDPTVDEELSDGERLALGEVVARTVELIDFCETFRKREGLRPLCYEVGTEEVHGGMTAEEDLVRFLNLLEEDLTEKGLGEIWPTFVVGQVGTDLHTDEFDPGRASLLTERLGGRGSYLKVHYTDGVKAPERLPESGVGGANVGPEFTTAEYEGLAELSSLEESLLEEGKIENRSNFLQALTEAVVGSGRWRKWLRPEEAGKEFDQLSSRRQEWMVETGARYVWTKPPVVEAREVLYNNLREFGYRPERIVSAYIERRMDKYYHSFNLVGLNARLQEGSD